MISGGCAFGHKSGNAYSGRGCECEYVHVGSFGGVVIRMENWTMCHFLCQSGRAGDEYNSGCVIKFRSQHWSASPFRGKHGHGNRVGGECRCGGGDERFVGSRRLEGSLLMEVNLRTEG